MVGWRLGETPAVRAARLIARRLRDAGFDAYFAGGSVRDLLLGVPAKDIDIATSARPEQAIQLFVAAGLKTAEVGAHFGVVLAVSEGVTIEVATFRHDGAYLDGRRPDQVRFSLDPREDVLRRDFTINGMLLDPALMDAELAVPASALLDFVGGQADLAARLIRTIGTAEVRFEEDKLRMLRGVRFAAWLGFAIERETLAAMRRHAAEIVQVSKERIRDELTRMLTEGHARRAFELLHESGLLEHVLPEVAKMRGVEQPPQYHPEGDVWVHTLMLLERLPAGCSPALAWGFLLHDVGKPATFQPPDPKKPGDRIRFNGHVEVGVRIAEVMLDRLRFSNDERAQIVALIKHHMQFGDIRAMKQSTLKRFVRMPRFDEHLALHKADCESSHGMLGLWEFAREAYAHDEPEATRPKWLVTGKELIAAGYRPGVAFKKMLEAAEDAQLEGRIASTDEGLTLIAQLFGKAGAKMV